MKNILTDKKIFFMGTPFFAAQILEGMVEKNIPIAWVITQPDKKTGRKKQLTSPAVKITAQKSGIPVMQFEKLDKRAAYFFKKEKPDLVVVAAYGLLVPKEILKIPKYGCINLHPSKLPSLRGPSPMQTALLLGLEKTALSIMLMDEEMDHGDILLQEDVAIDKNDTYADLEKKMIGKSRKILADNLEKWVLKKIIPQKQNHSKATFSKMIKKQDGKISWKKPTREIFNQFRAFQHWPKVYSFLDGKKITFHEINFNNNENLAEKSPGKIFLSRGDKMAIATGDGFILPRTIQLEGKKIINVEDFLNGHLNIIGKILQ
jgi:methionyl-tRNA formyltransferase